MVKLLFKPKIYPLLNSQNLNQEEFLDNLNVKGDDLEKTLDSLAFINKYFGNINSLSRTVCNLTLNRFNNEVSIVDLGCGKGDCLEAIRKILNSKNIRTNLLGIDGNSEIIKYAKHCYPNISFTQDDILTEKFIPPPCDIMISSHFIYHLDEHHLPDFLEKLKTQKVKFAVFSELYRSSMSYFLFKIASPILPINRIAKKDGLIAIRRAYSIDKLKAILETANVNFTIKKRPFFRVIVEIDLKTSF